MQNVSQYAEPLCTLGSMNQLFDEEGDKNNEANIFAETQFSDNDGDAEWSLYLMTNKYETAFITDQF